MLGNVLSCSRVTSLIIEKMHSWYLDHHGQGQGRGDRDGQHQQQSGRRDCSNGNANTAYSSSIDDRSLMKRKISTSANMCVSSSYNTHGHHHCRGDRDSRDEDDREYHLKRGRKGHTHVVPQLALATATVTPTSAGASSNNHNERGLPSFSSSSIDSSDVSSAVHRTTSTSSKSVKFFSLNQPEHGRGHGPSSPVTAADTVTVTTGENSSFYSKRNNMNNISKVSTPSTPRTSHGHSGYSRSAEILSAKTTVSMAIADSMIDNILGNDVS